MTDDLIRWIFDTQRAIDVLDGVELTPVPQPEVLQSELQLAREYLIARRGYYIEELAKRPAVIDELIRGIFDANVPSTSWTGWNWKSLTSNPIRPRLMRTNKRQTDPSRFPRITRTTDPAYKHFSRISFLAP